MKKTVVTLVLLVVILTAALFGYKYLSNRLWPEDTPEVGQSGNGAKTAADFTVTDMSGAEVKLSDYFGKPIVINFWATWCGPCNSELPAFDTVYGEYKDEVVFMMVNLTDGQRDTVDKVKNFVSEEGYAFPVYFDTGYSAVNAYGVVSIPTSVFIDKDGKVAGMTIGAMDEAVLRGYIDKLF